MKHFEKKEVKLVLLMTQVTYTDGHRQTIVVEAEKFSMKVEELEADPTVMLIAKPEEY